MALRQLMLSKKIEQRKASLAELVAKEDEFKTRSEGLEAAIDEAQTDEEIALVEGEITKLDEDRADIEGKKGKLEGEITALEGELEQINSNEPNNNPQPTPQPEGAERNKILGGADRMRSGKFFGAMKREEVNSLIVREEVVEFLTRTRELIGQSRAVTGAELNIPIVMLDLLRDNLHRYSKLITRINLKPVAGKARQNIVGAIPEGIWIEAVGSLNELALNFNQIEVDGYKVGGYIAVPNSILEDSDVNLANEIMDALGQAIGLAVDKAILFGTGSKMPVGIATRLAQTSQPSTWGKNAPAWTDLHTTNILKLDPTGMTSEQFFAALILKLYVTKANYSDGSKVWVMNSKTKAIIISKALTFNAAGAIVASVNNTMPIVGGDIVELEFMADNDIIGGYASLYLLAERAGSQLAVSDQVKFIEDMTVFKGTARYDGAPAFGEGFVLLNIANTPPTATVAFAPDSSNVADVYLSALTIGSLTLSPAFSSAVGTYTASTTNATNVITATAASAKATVSIKVNTVATANGTAPTWNTGANTVEITVTNGTTPAKVYTVIVTKS